MVEKLSVDDYSTLDYYTQAVLRRLRDEECTLSDACADMMHPLTAWDHGDKQEFVPYMKTMMAEWQRGGDDNAWTPQMRKAAHQRTWCNRDDPPHKRPAKLSNKPWKPAGYAAFMRSVGILLTSAWRHVSYVAGMLTQTLASSPNDLPTEPPRHETPVCARAKSTITTVAGKRRRSVSLRKRHQKKN